MDLPDAQVTKAAFDVAKDLVRDLISGSVSLGKKEIGRLSVQFEVGFRRFLDRNFRSVSKIKTLLNPSAPTALEAFYGFPNLIIQLKTEKEDKFLAWLEEVGYVVLEGAGGSGKSIFAKHLFIRYYNEGRGRNSVFCRT